MSTRPIAGHAALTEREKQTLRLIVRGHDAKSIARTLDLSVHTVNERLRKARRKMAASSSREAARMLLEAEGDGLPNSSANMKIGEAAPRFSEDESAAPTIGAGRTRRAAFLVTGVALMTLVLAFLALAALPQLAGPPAQTSVADAEPVDATVVESARRWLALVDQGRWDESYRATGEPFRKLNTSRMWASASEKVRTPLGAMVSRTLIGQQNIPAPPDGFQVVKFRTRFVNKAEAVETVTLDREAGEWRVVGVTIE